ncbi:MAG: mechanosensitive ion channel family protein [Gammaproteobacteria bacterium]|nr:mechanosensitive ion channel family protein [Gammaproteobacteria bacterium]MCK5262442.1 mechanosensitive ion channel family protein [Gammaproteobacteria bacterium]
MTDNQQLNQLLILVQNNDWIVQVFLIVLISLSLSFIARRAISKIAIKLQKTKNPWDDLLTQSLQKPVAWLIWLLGLTFAADVVHEQSGATIFEAVGPIRDIGVIIILTLFLLNLVRGTQAILVAAQTETGEQDFDEHTVEAISKLIRISIIITSGLVMLQTMGYSVSGVLAFGGIGGIAIGFAAKDLLSNFFGGLMIYMDRPFKIGDWIRSNDRDIEGTVEYIGWRLTRIRTFDKRPLYVPNSIFATISVENPSRMTNRRIYETIGIRYEDSEKMDAIVKDVKQMLLDHPEIDTKATLIVNFVSFSASSIDFFIYTFTKTTDWVRFHEIKQDVLLKIMNIINDHSAEMAFPTSTLHVESMPESVQNQQGVKS